MAEAATKLPITTEEKGATPPATRPERHPFESLRRAVDSVFDDFRRSVWRSPFVSSTFDIEPFWRREAAWGAAPAVDVVEKDNGYEITAELPGLDPADVELKFANGTLTIKGEKKEEKEEKKKGYYLSERRYGSFQRSFQAPDDIDADKIAASFEKGVLKVTLPKAPGAQNKEKKSPLPRSERLSIAVAPARRSNAPRRYVAWRYCDLELSRPHNRHAVVGCGRHHGEPN